MRWALSVKAVVDWQSNLLLNINNRYFVHYGLIYEFSEMVTKSRTTQYDIYKVINIECVKKL